MLAEAAGIKKKLSYLFVPANPYIAGIETGLADVSRYLALKTAISLVTGVLSGIWWAAWGVDFALLWGFFTFVINFIPSIGPAISFVPPMALALLTLDPWSAVAAGAGHLTIGFLIGNLVEPPLIGKRLRLATLTVFLAMFFWGCLWGPLGALFAVPLTLVLRNVLEVNSETRWFALAISSDAYAQAQGRVREGIDRARKSAA